MANMAPRRRSSRLRHATPLKLPTCGAAAQLESVTEYHEASILEPESNNKNMSPVPKTPVTAGRIRPAPEEMHPSKVHQSTTQEPDSGLRLGFTDIKADKTDQPSGFAQKTPSKVNVASSSFDFRFARPGLQLGPEAQRMMDELHEEALQIKARLAAESEEKKRMIFSDEHLKTRRQAKPRCKAGRFSDAHKAEFKKMDSIAGHPSTFRAKLPQPTLANNNLKRSRSKAQLKVGYSNEKDSKFDKCGENSNEDSQNQVNQPTKIARKHVTDDISSASRNQDKSSISDHRYIQSKIPSSVNTPTQASLSRTSVKKMNAGRSTLKSPQKINIGNALHIDTRNTHNINTCDIESCNSQKLHNHNKLDRVRFPDLGSETAAGPIIIADLVRKGKYELPKVLSSIPNTLIEVGNPNNAKNFTPKTVNKHAAAQKSPSPKKSGSARSISKSTLNVDSSTVSKIKVPEISRKVEYPSLTKFQSPRRFSSHDCPSTSIPGTFTFRSDQTIKFGASPNHSGSVPLKNGNFQILGNNNKSELIAGTFLASDKENETLIQSLPSGISKKRRKRPESDDEQKLIEPLSKKPKSQYIKSTIPRLKALQSSIQEIPSYQKKPGVLSLSRLNILSRPKIRR